MIEAAECPSCEANGNDGTSELTGTNDNTGNGGLSGDAYWEEVDYELLAYLTAYEVEEIESREQVNKAYA